MFEKAARLKLRFDTSRGALSVEDLFDLPLQTTRANGVSLDQIAIALDKKLRETTTVSFVDDTTTANAETQLQFDLVKHVIGIKKAENAAAKAKQDAAARKQHLMELINKKKDEALGAKSIEELQAELAAL